MNRLLYILRHAEAASAADDFVRPLTATGVANMKALAHRLATLHLKPDFVLCSPARRTRMTLEHLFPEAPASFPAKLYNATAETIYGAVKNADDAYGSVMIVAHNPGIFNFMRLMAPPDSGVPVTYGPGTLAIFQCAIENWADLMPGKNSICYMFSS